MKKLAVITGATGGIGKSFARQLAQKGYHLLLVGRRRDALQKTADEVRKASNTVINILQCDFSKPRSVKTLTHKLNQIKNIELLVNCVGYGERKEFLDDRVENHLVMLQVHVASAISLLYSVLPQMIKSKNGKIIMVSSLAGFIPAPGSSVYAATKSFINVLMESIYMEVRQYNIKIQSLCPGFTHTDFQKKTGATEREESHGLIRWMEADEVVDYSLHHLEKDDGVICIPGLVNKTVKKLIPLLPRSPYYFIVKKITRRIKKKQ